MSLNIVTAQGAVGYTRMTWTPDLWWCGVLFKAFFCFLRPSDIPYRKPEKKKVKWTMMCSWQSPRLSRKNTYSNEKDLTFNINNIKWTLTTEYLEFFVLFDSTVTVFWHKMYRFINYISNTDKVTIRTHTFHHANFCSHSYHSSLLLLFA